MSKNNYSMNILLVELIHFVVGIGFGVIPWGWAAGVLFVLWKELRYDPKNNYGEHGVNWLWQVPRAILTDAGHLIWTEYRWGWGRKQVIGFVKKALMLDMVFYAAGIIAGTVWGPW